MLAFAVRDVASLGAGIGLIIGFGFAKFNASRSHRGAVSVIITAWALVAIIIGMTLFALFGADVVSTKVVSFFLELGPNMMIGQGFGIAGQSFSSSLAAGLGVVGVALAGLIVMATLFQSLLGHTHSTRGENFSIAIWVAALCAILSSPTEIAVFGPVAILFFAMSFSISLSAVAAPRPRQALTDRQQMVPPFKTRTPEFVKKVPTTTDATPALNSLGLRSKL